ncbi:MAG TPA: ABC transporter ATP-binding protein [Candidatus Dormibacteraeota bacterium]|nr:ABC transporter ATP-binding protein [Candidatus Dormibacteraeota bacterium]
MAAIATADHVQRKFGNVLALSDVTFELQKGVTGLLGANGAGKTTLISLFLGVLRPDAGKLEVLGMDPLKAGYKLRQRIGYAPEDDRFPPDVKASELVRHFAEMRGIPHRAAVVRASEVLFEVGLGEERFRPIGTMSTGQRQRVKLAQALVHDPELVLLDEPTNGLDPIQRDDMLALVRRIGTDLGFTVLISSHLLGEVEQVSDFIVMLEGGRVARSGSMKGLLGGDTPMVVEVVSGAKRLAAFLSSKGFAATAKDDLRLTVPASAEGVQDAIVAGVVELDLEMRRMERGAATLGELFDLEEAPAR